MDSETSISKREKPIVGRYCVFQFFSQTAVSDEVLKKLKEVKIREVSRFVLAGSDFEREKQSEILQNQKQMEKSREVELVCQCLSGNLE